MSCIYCISTLGLHLQGSVNPLVMSHEESAFVAAELATRILQLQRRRQSKLTSVVIDDIRGRFRANIDRCNDFYVAIVTLASEVPYFASQVASVVKSLLATVGATDCASVQVSVRAHFLLEEIVHCEAAIDPSKLTSVADVLAMRGPLGPSTEAETFLHRSVGGVDPESSSSAGVGGMSGKDNSKPEATLQESAFAFPDDGVAAVPEIDFDPSLHVVQCAATGAGHVTPGRHHRDAAATAMGAADVASPASAAFASAALPTSSIEAAAAATATMAASAAAAEKAAVEEKRRRVADDARKAAEAAAAKAAAAAAAAQAATPAPKPVPTLDDVFGAPAPRTAAQAAATPPVSSPASRATSTAPVAARPASTLDDIDDDGGTSHRDTSSAGATAPSPPPQPKPKPVATGGDLFDDWFSGPAPSGAANAPSSSPPAAGGAASTAASAQASKAASPTAATSVDLFGAPSPAPSAAVQPAEANVGATAAEVEEGPSAAPVASVVVSSGEAAASVSVAPTMDAPAAVTPTPDPHVAASFLPQELEGAAADIADEQSQQAASVRQQSNATEPSPMVPVRSPPPPPLPLPPSDHQALPFAATAPLADHASAAIPADVQPVGVSQLVRCSENGTFVVGVARHDAGRGGSIEFGLGSLETADGDVATPDLDAKVTCPAPGTTAWAERALLPQNLVPALAEMTATRSGADVVVKLYYAWNPEHPTPRYFDITLPIPSGTKALVRPAPNATVTDTAVVWHIVADTTEKITAATLMAAKLSGPAIADTASFSSVTAQLEWAMDAPVVPITFARVAGSDQRVDVANMTSRSDGFFSTSMIKGS